MEMLKHAAIVVLSLAVAACSDTGTGLQQGGIVRITVYGAPVWNAQVEPLTDVLVTILGRSELTNDLGIAYVAHVDPGLRHVQIDRDGSEPATADVLVVVGDTADIVKELIPVRPPNGALDVLVEVPVAPGSPEIINPEGAAVSTEGSVRLTDASGHAIFPIVPAGEHWVRASYTGAVPDSALVEVLGGDTLAVTIRLALIPPS